MLSTLPQSSCWPKLQWRNYREKKKTAKGEIPWFVPFSANDPFLVFYVPSPGSKRVTIKFWLASAFLIPLHAPLLVWHYGCFSCSFLSFFKIFTWLCAFLRDLSLPCIKILAAMTCFHSLWLLVDSLWLLSHAVPLPDCSVFSPVPFWDISRPN